MTKAIRVYEAGGPEVMKWEDVEVGDPGPGQIRIKQTAVGLNYIDVYFRSGLYPVEFPAIIGQEAAGVVEAVGEGVTEFAPGDRVAYPMVPGAYTEARVMPTLKVVKLPDSISDQTAAAMMLKGMTAQYLLFRTYKVQPGDNILVYAAAGGVGQILCQWAKKTRRQCHRLCRLARKSRARDGQRLRSSDPVPRRRHCLSGQRTDRRRGCCGCL